MRAKKVPPGIRAVQTGGIQNGRTIEAAEHRQGCGSAADSGGNRNPGGSAASRRQGRVAENSGDRPVRLHPSPAGIGGCDSGLKKTELPDAVKADLKAFYQEHKL